MNERPSILGSFAKGALSSAFSGALMAGIVALVSTLPFLGLTALGFKGAAMMIIATGLFGGAMAVKRVMFDTPATAGRNGDTNFIPVPVPGISGPAIAPLVSADMAPEAEQPTKNWAAETGRDGDAQSRIQQIIAQGAMSDKDRASAILAERVAAANSFETARG